MLSKEGFNINLFVCSFNQYRTEPKKLSQGETHLQFAVTSYRRSLDQGNHIMYFPPYASYSTSKCPPNKD